MGIDVSVHINNNIFEKNIIYTLEKLKEISSYDVIISSFHDNKEKKIGFEWIVNIDDYHTVEECFENDKYIKLIRRWDTVKETEFWFSKNSIDVFGEEFMIRGRWHYFLKFLIGDIKKDDFNEEDFIDYKNWFDGYIERIIEYGKIFNSNELIMFCGDLNQDIQEKLWTGETIEKILKNDMWTIIEDIPYKINMDNYENYDTARFLFHKKWENNLFDINKWKKLFG